MASESSSVDLAALTGSGGGRGVSQAQVWAAADALLRDGARPTIEKVRLRLGRGSPNTVSPMLDRWFATLGQRLAGEPTHEAGETTLRMPLAIGTLAQRLWDGALAEATSSQRQASEAERRELALSREAIDAQAAELQTRALAFESHRSQLEAALAGSQQTMATMREQLNAAGTRAQTAEQQCAKLRLQFEEAQASQARLKEVHAAALQAKDQAAREAEDRHVAHERRLLSDIDRERQATRAAVAETAREHKLRMRAEEGSASLETAQSALQRVVDHLKAQAEARLRAATQERKDHEDKLDDARAALLQERGAHQQTRDMLASAIVTAQTSRPKTKTLRKPRKTPD